MKYSRVTWHVSDTFLDASSNVLTQNIPHLDIKCKQYLLKELSGINGGYFTKTMSILMYPGSKENILQYSVIVPTITIADVIGPIADGLKDISKNESIVVEVVDLDQVRL